MILYFFRVEDARREPIKFLTDATGHKADSASQDPYSD
jgi:hypothetical protein